MPLTGCGNQNADIQAEPSLQTVAVKTLNQTDFYAHKQFFSGNIRAANTTGVGFELSGKIKQLYVDSGDKVSAKQPLAQLDVSILLAQQQEVDASLLQNQADIDLARSTLNRSLELTNQGYISEQTLDEVKGQLNSLLARKKQLQASLSAINLNLEKSTLLAPFEGSVAERHQNLGGVVQLGSPVFTLIQSNTPQAFIGVPVEVARSFSTDQQVSVKVGKQTYTARIRGISGQLNPVTRTQEVRIALPKNAAVINGELAYLDYQQQIQQTGYWVPIAALTEGMRGLWNIYVIKPQEHAFIVQRRDVEIIYTDRDKAYIQGAISDKEQFVSQGLHKLVSGQLVNPQEHGHND
ncbi:RND transporter MFP subunit [Shewanella gelidii]|uniref:RND transporter MFP subunit n=2 Tax=Shewanella gelidii TaxID=1642821 RepID=A0A917N5N0_9GAMM|nr:RND transporter MFP subunit [Shewanella gelidii]